MKRLYLFGLYLFVLFIAVTSVRGSISGLICTPNSDDYEFRLVNYTASEPVATEGVRQLAPKIRWSNDGRIVPKDVLRELALTACVDRGDYGMFDEGGLNRYFPSVGATSPADVLTKFAQAYNQGDYELFEKLIHLDYLVFVTREVFPIHRESCLHAFEILKGSTHLVIAMNPVDTSGYQIIAGTNLNEWIVPDCRFCFETIYDGYLPMAYGMNVRLTIEKTGIGYQIRKVEFLPDF